MGARNKADQGRRTPPPAAADVLIVGCGPTGMMLAAELALAGVDVIVVERRLNQDLPGSRAGGLHARTIEVLDQRGIADRFLAAGEITQTHMFGNVTLDISDFPTRHPYGLALWQAEIEAILAGWVAEFPVRVHRGREVVGVAQDDHGVDIALDDDTSLRARYVVGCDGGRSVVRRAVGISFLGWDASTSYMLAEATMPDEPELGMKFDAVGRHAIGPLADGGGRVRLVVQEVPPRPGDQPTLDELRQGVISVWGGDFGLHSPTWISRFSDAARQAVTYRERRVLLAGDAAHVHSPIGGQGLGTGLQDAVNLGWKLALVVKGEAPESLLDTYHEERHPVGAQVLQGTLAQTALMNGDERTAALRDTLADLVVMDEPRRKLAARLAGLDLRYDLGGTHPLVGRRIPDLDLVIEGDGVQLFSLLHRGHPALIDFGSGEAPVQAAWSDRVAYVAANYDGPWELPVLGSVDAPAAVLVRPDGYVAWAGSPDDPELPKALTTWFGPPANQ